MSGCSRSVSSTMPEKKEAFEASTSNDIGPIAPNIHFRGVVRRRSSRGDSSRGSRETNKSKPWLAWHFSRKLSLESLIGGSSFSATDGNHHRSQGFWTRMANNSNVWSDDVDEGGEEAGPKKSCASYRYEVQLHWKVVKENPRIPAISMACLLVLIVVSTVICVEFNHEYRRDLSELAQRIALESAQRLQEELEEATMVPLHTLASFVPELSQFQNLPMLIGEAGQPGSAPFINNSLFNNSSTTMISRRNTSGICDNETLLTTFSRIAKNIKDGYGKYNGVVNLQLAPEGVVCLVYPINNTEDFKYPLFLDNSGVIGLDNLATQERRSLSEKTLQTSDVVTAGPLQLSQCIGCPPEVKTAIIARISIPMPSNLGYQIHVGEHSYSSWGFATVILNWQYLMNQFDIQKTLEYYGIEFILSKTDLIYNTSTNTYDRRISTILKSQNPHAIKNCDFLNFSLPVSNNNWTISVAYRSGWEAPWFPWVMLLSIILSIGMSLILLIVLIQKKMHKQLLKEMFPSSALKRKLRNQIAVDRYEMVTICFCDIVGFTNLCSDMRPIQVIEMINSLYKRFDKLVEKHNVYKMRIIGDAYMCVSGCPHKCTDVEGAERIALFSLELIELVKQFRMDDGTQILVRVGIHSGSAIGGFVGTNRPSYNLFGKTVDIASSMETSSEPMRVLCSASTYGFLLRSQETFIFSDDPFNKFTTDEELLQARFLVGVTRKERRTSNRLLAAPKL